MSYLITLFLSLVMLITAGCGFSLQDSTQIPESLKTLRLISDDPYGPLANTIKQQLSFNNINLINKSINTVPILKIIDSSENIETISIYQFGKSAEKQLNFWLNAQIILPNSIIHPIKIRVERNFFDHPLAILAKDSENELLKQEMREQAARQLIHKLLIIINTNIKINLKKQPLHY